MLEKNCNAKLWLILHAIFKDFSEIGYRFDLKMKAFVQCFFESTGIERYKENVKKKKFRKEIGLVINNDIMSDSK